MAERPTPTREMGAMARRIARQRVHPNQASPDGERLRVLLMAMCAAQDVAPYRGWNLSALNKASAEARAYLGLPSVRELNPDIAAMQDHAVANKDALNAALASPDDGEGK